MDEPTNGPAMMSFDEIEARFDSEWVLILEPDITETLEVRRGKVACHSKDREDISRALQDTPPGTVAILYIGEPSKDLEFLL